MTPDHTPSLNKIYAGFILLAGFATGGLFLYFAAQPSTDTPTALLIVEFAILAVAGTVYAVYSAAQIRLTACGIRAGKKQISWLSVSKIETIGYGIHIYAADTKIVIAPWAYNNPDAVIAYIREKLQKQTNQ